MEGILYIWILEIDLFPPFSELDSKASNFITRGRFIQVKCEKGFQDMDLWITNSLKKSPKNGKIPLSNVLEAVLRGHLSSSYTEVLSSTSWQ